MFAFFEKVFDETFSQKVSNPESLPLSEPFLDGTFFLKRFLRRQRLTSAEPSFLSLTFLFFRKERLFDYEPMAEPNHMQSSFIFLL